VLANKPGISNPFSRSHQPPKQKHPPSSSESDLVKWLPEGSRSRMLLKRQGVFDDLPLRRNPQLSKEAT
jgi:hypothetical protein